MHGGRWRQDLRTQLTISAAVDLAVAVGAGTTRRVEATVLRPLTGTALGALRRGEHLLLGGSCPSVVEALALRAELLRKRAGPAAADLAREVLRRSVEWAVTSLDLTELVGAHVDLDALAALIDVDAVVARADVDAVVARADVDAVVARADVDAVVARVDIDAVLDQIDLDAVLARVDLDALLARIDLEAVLARVDLDALVARVDLTALLAEVDLDAVLTGVDVDGIVSRVDLDAVLTRVDLDAVLARVEPDPLISRVDLDTVLAGVDVDRIVSRVDLDAVLARLDLAQITREVIDAIDLPEILRQSTGAVSSQAARTVRAEGMNADESVARFVDRVLRRPHPRGAVT